ncbi:hypothetical protein ACFYUY_01765 [Kitasatospora sp. NPDC004745]|uniref:hypothetical protein n=1 Tax=Kitasatospora sp. NPDC004745 TaxID=3364019 RepID=UPI0036BC24F9
MRLLALVDQRRAQLGLSQQLLAVSLGTSASALKRMSRGGAPDAHLLLRLLLWLGWAPELVLLVEGGGEPTCGSCRGFPPAGFSCIRCAAVGVWS